MMTVDASTIASNLGISTEAAQLAVDSDVIDLHIDTFILTRLVRYNMLSRHRSGFLGGRFFGHADLPRMTEGGLTGGLWSITTNPFRPAGNRWRIFRRNLKRFKKVVDGSSGQLRFARTAKEYADAREAGAHACMLSVQGGNAFVSAPNGPLEVDDRLLTRVTLVHLTNSEYGASSTPIAARFRTDHGLTRRGKELVEQLNAGRIFVDLAHIHPKSFWDAVEIHDKSQPLIDTHTGVRGVCNMWRNLDDDQIRAIADTGGTIGMIFAQHFLQPGGGDVEAHIIIDHMQHIIDVAGEDHVSIGTDYDGAVVPPTDVRSVDCMPRLIQHMLDRGWSDTRIQKILAGNYLRSFAALRSD